MFFITLSAFVLVTSNNINSYKQLQKSLMANYSNKIRPLHYQDETVYIYISFYLSSLIEVDTVHQRLVTAAHLGVVWVDEFLQWDQESTGIEVLHFKQVRYTEKSK